MMSNVFKKGAEFESRVQRREIIMLSSAEICICISIVAYLVAMLLIGMACSKKNKTTDDFYLGGRHLGPMVTAMSAEASDMSSWLLMGLPGVAYLSGVADAGWTAIGLAAGTYLNWLLVAKRIRRYTIQVDAITIPDFFSKRFGDDRRLLTAIAAVVSHPSVGSVMNAAAIITPSAKLWMPSPIRISMPPGPAASRSCPWWWWCPSLS